MDYITLIIALIAATFTSMLGYLKNRPEEDFQPEKLFSTYLAAFIVAVLLVFFKVPMPVGEELVHYFVMQSGAIVILERIFKFLWRTYIQPYLDKMNP